MTIGSNDTNGAPMGPVLPAGAARRPYTTPVLKRFGLVRDWTQKSGNTADGGSTNKKA